MIDITRPQKVGVILSVLTKERITVMTSKSKSADKDGAKEKVKPGKLKLNKESVRDLTPSDQGGIKGGAIVTPAPTKARQC
jgi:hypothetical protein